MRMRVIVWCVVALASVTAMPAPGQSFTLQQALSAPFASDLVASPKLGRLAWIENQQGRRNLWIAEPNASGKYVSKRLTSYDQDDGQEMYQIVWTPDAEQLVYVRGGDSGFPESPIQIPRWRRMVLQKTSGSFQLRAAIRESWEKATTL